MRLGLIARADARGLGVQCKSVYDNLHPVKTMVVDCPSAKPLPLRRDWYPGATWVHGLPTAQDFRTWLDGLDVVYTAETGYSPALWDEAERAGVRTVLHANYEFLDHRDRPSVWAAPSLWRFDEWPTGTQFLPVPIDTSPVSGCKPDLYAHLTGIRFLHVVGRPATRDRNGTEDLLAALLHVTADIRLTVTCQEPGYVESMLHRFHVPANVELVVRSGDVDNNLALYEGQDVLVLPRRFGGLCLPCNEALGAGMPVIMPTISPNDSWLPSDWLIPATPQGSFMAKQRVDFYSVDHRALAEKINAFASDAGFFQKAKREATELRDQLSWERLLPTYQKVLNGDESVLVGRA